MHRSWTADEDFHVLLDALTLLDCKWAMEGEVSGRFDENDGLRVVCVVTGVGPLKAYYEQCISELPLKHIIIKTMLRIFCCCECVAGWSTPTIRCCSDRPIWVCRCTRAAAD